MRKAIVLAVALVVGVAVSAPSAWAVFGACCKPDGTCRNAVSAGRCDLFEGDFFPDQTCDDIECGDEPFCGDGNLDPGEQCDDGNNLDGDGCSADCMFEEPGLDVTKVCEPQVDGSNDVSVQLENTGAFDLTNCEVTDRIFPGSTACQGDSVVVGTQTVDLVPVGGSATVYFTVDELITDSCNKATVTCDLVTGGTITKTDEDLCEVGNLCLTRTPGFYGTHTHVTELFLPVVSCGLSVDGVLPETPVSATEDMCRNAGDAAANSTSPQQLQLIRQCTAAALNFAASAAGGGNCSGHTSDIVDVLASCCDDLCNSGASGPSISSSLCIERIDAFNNSNDTLPAFGPFISPGPADPTYCQESNGNGWVNPGRNLGPGRSGGGNTVLSTEVEAEPTDESSSAFGGN